MEVKPVPGEFRFRKFSVRHDRCGMKVGTDGILLGAWANVERARAILDVGTGCGLIALMLAQRNPTARIDAIEIDPDAANQAGENVYLTPWEHRIRVSNMSFQELLAVTRGTAPQYDRIVCNPPYFPGIGEPSPSARRMARHDVRLTLRELVVGAKQLLDPDGRLCLIVPEELADPLQQTAAMYRLNLNRHTTVHPRPDSPPKRRLMEFGVWKNNPLQETLVIETSKHVYSAAWQRLTGEFYL